MTAVLSKMAQMLLALLQEMVGTVFFLMELLLLNGMMMHPQKYLN